MLFGIGGSSEEVNDYIQNFIQMDSFGPIYNGYQYTGGLGGFMNTPYFSQPEPMNFNSVPGNHYNIHGLNYGFNGFN